MNNKHRDIEGNDIDSWKRRYNRYLRWRVFVFKSVCIVKASVGQILSAISEPLICVCRIFLSVAAACTLCTPRGRGTLDLFAFFSPSFINPWPQPWRTSRGIRKRRARKINLAEYSYGSAVNIPTTINSGLPSWIPRSTLLLSFFAHNRSFSSYFFPFFFLSFFLSFFFFISFFSSSPLSSPIFSWHLSHDQFLTSRHLSEGLMTSTIVASQNYTEAGNEFRDTCRYSCIDSAVRVCLITPFRRVIDNVIIDFREIHLDVESRE